MKPTVKDLREELIKSNSRSVITSLNSEAINKARRLLLEAYIKNKFNPLTRK